MPSAGLTREKPWGEAVHATAVALAGRGLLIFGPSGSGKSSLALALIAGSTARCPIRLVGDDRILLTQGPHGLVARPHPRIAGFIERRGLGIVSVPFVASAPVVAIIDLGLTTLPPILGQNLRGTLNVYNKAAAGSASSDAVLTWWRDACTTPAPKATTPRPVLAKV